MKNILYIFLFSPLIGFAQGQVDCSLLSVMDVIIQNDSITFEIYNADTMDTHYPYVSYTLDSNGDTIQKGQVSWYVTFAGTSSFYYSTNHSISFVMDSLTEFNVNYPLSIYFSYANLTGDNPGGYSCELIYDPLFGCMSSEAFNYDAEASIDDGSCVWLDCDGELNYVPLNILVEDSVCHSNLYCENFNWDGGDCVYDCNNDLMTLWDINTYFYNGQCDQILDCMVYNFDNESCIENTNSDCGGISITINSGWNMIGFSCSENTDAIEAFSSIQDKIVIAKDALGNAYLPSFNFNGIGDLERGYGYLIKVTEEINNYNICE